VKTFFWRKNFQTSYSHSKFLSEALLRSTDDEADALITRPFAGNHVIMRRSSSAVATVMPENRAIRP